MLINKLNKSIASTLFTASLYAVMVNNVNAAQIISFSPPMYGINCAISIDARVFEPSAMTPIIDTEVTLQTDLYLPVYMAIQNSTLQATQSISASLKGISINNIKQNEINNNMLLEVKKNEIESEEFKKESLRVLNNKNKNQAFNDGSGELTLSYYRQLCTKSKMLDQLISEKARTKSSATLNLALDESINEANNSSSSISKIKKKQDEKYNYFCSLEDKNNNLCTEVSVFQNGDLDSNLFLYPVGDKLNNTEFKTVYTYNDTEAEISVSYIENLVGSSFVESPSVTELNDSRRRQFVSYYNHLESLRNLSKYNMYKLWNNRIPVNKEGNKLSKIDYYRYIISQFGDKITQLESGASSDSLDVSIYAAQALINQLQMEILMQKEDLNKLDAGILSQMSNSPMQQKYMKDIK